jgi:hypothetical protein
MKAGDIINTISLGKVVIVRINKSGTIRVRFYNRHDESKQVTIRADDVIKN